MLSSDVEDLVQQAAAWLQEHQVRLVLAESCTAGLVSAWLGRKAGISQFLCGSMVTYRDATKQSWLHVPNKTLQFWSAVSQPVTDCMAMAVLNATPEATLAIAVTGHLGPNAPAELDGQIFLSAAARYQEKVATLASLRQSLGQSRRSERQAEAALCTLDFLRTLDPPSLDLHGPC